MAGNYLYEISIPANTSFYSPSVTDLALSPGILTRLTLGFPPGCAALLRVQILQDERVIYPSNSDNSYGWDDIFFVLEPFLVIPEDYRMALAVRAWNDDTLFSHSLLVNINVVGLDTQVQGLFDLQKFGWGF